MTYLYKNFIFSFLFLGLALLSKVSLSQSTFIDSISSQQLITKYKAPADKKKFDTVRLYFRNENASLGRKWLRAEKIIALEEIINMAILSNLPRESVHWPEDYNFFRDAFKYLKRAWTTPPVWDQDPFFVNYVGHPYAGGFYYNSLRSQGATKMQSFIFSVVQSTFFEYVVEGVIEQPSIQDLIATPLIGSALGELSHKATIAMRKKGFTFLEKVVVLIINPIYVVDNGYKIHRSPFPVK